MIFFHLQYDVLPWKLKAQKGVYYIISKKTKWRPGNKAVCIIATQSAFTAFMFGVNPISRANRLRSPLKDATKTLSTECTLKVK